MAFPVADFYTVAPGQPVNAGRFAPSNQPISMTALVGDSLTDKTFGLTTAPWLGGIAGGVLQPVHNAGVSADTIANVLARIDNNYLNASPGMAGVAAAMGVTKLGYIMLRIGTNDARASSNYAAISANFGTLMTKLAGYADRVLIMSVPPISAPVSGFAAQNANTISINSGYASYAAANPSYCSFIDDAASLRVGGLSNGDGISAYFSEGIHMNGSGIRRMGLAGGDLLTALLPTLGYTYLSPLVTSNADSYSANPSTSTQWTNNPAMLGSGVQTGSWPGAVVTGVEVRSNGSGAGAVSIVAADAGDANQTPWQRVTPSGGQATVWSQASMTTSGRAVSATDPSRMEALVEVRFNALDLTNVRRLTLTARGIAFLGQNVTPNVSLALGPEVITVSKIVTLRTKYLRGAGQIEEGISLYLALEYENTFNGAAMGSFDFRCITLRG